MPPVISGYRADIDGLRAVAVLAVVLFHAFPKALRGGFVGVDVFFVISGFLISSILFTNLAQERFSLAEFYSRRVRRILPALITVLASCLVAGWFVLLAHEYLQLGRHVAGGSAFISNLLLWRESGYFDTAAETKPLLHLWSLAIEEQFYLVWPLLLALGWQRRWPLPALAGGVAAASFAWGLVLLHQGSTAAFYSPLARFWELMSGGLLAWVVLRRPAWTARPGHWCSVVGLGLVLAGLALTNRSRDFPGWWALLPVSGAVLLIAAGPHAWVNRRLLSSRAMVAIGLVSYPLYLWHWPLLAFARILTTEPSPLLRALMVVAAGVLAVLTYRFVETPLRHARSPRTVPGLLASLAVVGMAGLSCVLTGGFGGTGFRDPERSAFLDHFENSAPAWRFFEREGIPAAYREQCNFYDLQAFRLGQATRQPVAAIADECFKRDPARPRALLLWGDSHAAQLYAGLHLHLPPDWQILQVTSSGCVPAPPPALDAAGDYCAHSNGFAWDLIKSARPDVVVVAQQDRHDASALELMQAALAQAAVPHTVFAGPAPRWTAPLPDVIARRLWQDTPERSFVGLDTRTLARDRQLHASLRPGPGNAYVSLVDHFCDARGCLTRIGADRQRDITTWDQGHLMPGASAEFAQRRLVPAIARIVPTANIGPLVDTAESTR